MKIEAKKVTKHQLNEYLPLIKGKNQKSSNKSQKTMENKSDNSFRELAQITFAIFGHFLTTYVPSLHFLCSKLHDFLTTYPPLSANVICESSLN